MGAIYGKIYNWYAVAGIYNAASLANPSLRKQLAPIGCHIPNEIEWNILINYLDPIAAGGYNSNTAGSKMKETGILHWVSPNTGATNASGFTGLPAGFRNYGGAFFSIGRGGYWGNSGEIDQQSTRTRSVSGSFTSVIRVNMDKVEGFSIRCIKD